MKKILLVIAAVLVLGGCDEYTEKKSWSHAEARCATNGGVASVSDSYYNGYLYVETICGNGASFKDQIEDK